jgi:hypothetical protein
MATIANQRWISIHEGGTPSQEVHSGLGIFKMAANIKIKKIVQNSKMKKIQWKWIFTGSKTCCYFSDHFGLLWRPF